MTFNGSVEAQSLTGDYSGSVENLTAGISAKVEFILRDNKGDLSGCMVVYQPLSGSGPLRGRFSDNEVSFTASSPMFVIEGKGRRRGDRLTGTYLVRVADGSLQNGKFDVQRVSGEGLSDAFAIENCPKTASLDKLTVGNVEYWVYTEYGASYILDRNFRYTGVRTVNNEAGEPILFAVDQGTLSTYYDTKGNYLKWLSVSMNNAVLYIYDATPRYYFYDQGLNYLKWYAFLGGDGKLIFANEVGSATRYYAANFKDTNFSSFKLETGELVFVERSGGVNYYYDSAMKPLGLYSFERGGKTFFGKVVGQQIVYYDGAFRPLQQYKARLPRSWYASQTFTDSFGNTVSGSSINLGSVTLHNFWSSYGELVSGSSINVGRTTFHNLYSSYGSSLSGSSMRVGSTEFTNLYGSDGSYTSGTSSRIGNTTFYNFFGSDGATTGSTIRIGNFEFHNLYGPGGTVTGTTTRIGNFTFSNYFWNQ